MTGNGIADLIKEDRDEPFWKAWQDGERFLLHRCHICGRCEWPATCCIDHGLAPMLWVETSGTGTIDSYTIFHRAYDPAMVDLIPYVVAVIRLDEGPYFHSRIVDAPLQAIATGLRVAIRRNAGDDFPLFLLDDKD